MSKLPKHRQMIYVNSGDTRFGKPSLYPILTLTEDYFERACSNEPLRIVSEDTQEEISIREAARLATQELEGDVCED